MTSKISIGLVAILVTAITIPTAYAMLNPTEGINPTEAILDTGCLWKETDLKLGTEGNCKIWSPHLNNTFGEQRTIVALPPVPEPVPEPIPVIEFTAKIDYKQDQYYDGDIILVSGTVDKSAFANEIRVYVEVLDEEQELATIMVSEVDDNTYSIGIKIDKAIWGDVSTEYHLIVSYGPVGIPIQLDYQIKF